MQHTPADSDFCIGEIESEDDYRGVLNAEPLTRIFPRAIVTNFTPFSDGAGVPQPQKAQPLIDAGFTCLVECDTRVNPNATINRQVFFAQQCGFSVIAPVVYLNDNYGLDQYPDRTRFANWSVWLAGNVL